MLTCLFCSSALSICHTNKNYASNLSLVAVIPNKTKMLFVNVHWNCAFGKHQIFGLTMLLGNTLLECKR